MLRRFNYFGRVSYAPTGTTDKQLYKMEGTKVKYKLAQAGRLWTSNLAMCGSADEKRASDHGCQLPEDLARPHRDR